MLKGGCYCGAVRYEAAGTPFNETNCHCSICRRTTSAPFVAWFSVRRGDFRFVAGTPTQFNSTDKGRRAFCGRCGTQLTFESTDVPGEIDIAAVSLDDPNAVPPKDHTRTSSKLSWVKLADGLPEYRERRLSGNS
ncbi:MAG TPA: GFA family protein [Burkholderiales bacterium]|nr:GFA family protein [Burkholderiales bacterium]